MLHFFFLSLSPTLFLSLFNFCQVKHANFCSIFLVAFNAKKKKPLKYSQSLNSFVFHATLFCRVQNRSTKSEKLYPSLLTRGPDVELEPYYCLPVGAQHNGVLSAQMAAAAAANAQANNHNQQNNSIAWSQPTSPTPMTRGFSGPMSPTHANTLAGMQALTQGSTAAHRLTYPKKNDEGKSPKKSFKIIKFLNEHFYFCFLVHGSTASLLSGGSSLYGTSEERQAQEIRRLKRELMEAREQVLSLSGQLSTNVSTK